MELKAVLENLKRNEFTKRFVLQVADIISDPVGFIAPFTVRIKYNLQEIWILGLDWDEEIPGDKKKDLELALWS